jgi:ribonuclease HI
MQATSPHYLLFSEVTGGPDSPAGCFRGQWRFVLEAMEGGRRVIAQDAEPGIKESRLELLAVVRGLEALDGPAHVTLITRSQYVSRGLRGGMGEWRRNDWHWERFGQWVPIRDDDLWKRIDRALCFHHVDCRVWSFTDKMPYDFAETSQQVDHGSTCRGLGCCASKSRRVLNSRRRVARRALPRQLVPSVCQRSPQDDSLSGKYSRGWSTDLSEPFVEIARSVGGLLGITKLAEV